MFCSNGILIALKCINKCTMNKTSTEKPYLFSCGGEFQITEKNQFSAFISEQVFTIRFRF